MKKLFAILMIVCTMMTAVAFAGEAVPFAVKDGVTFGMSQKALIAGLGNTRYELDKENTRGGVSFTEVEVENQKISGLRADVHYLFYNKKLAAVHVDFDAHNAYDQVKAKLVKAYQDSAPVDLALLGKGIYAVDDDGRLEGKTESWINNNVMIILEKDRDGDVDVYLVDLSAAYIK